MENASHFDIELDGLFLENSSYDYGDYTNYEEDLHILSVFIPVLYSLALIVGLLGNGLLLVVLYKLLCPWSVTHTFILHLLVANTLLLLTLPFWAAEAAQGWSFGSPLCMLMGAIFKIVFCCGNFLLACMSVDQYLSIVHNVQMYSKLNPWKVQVNFLLVWLVCLLLCIPDWIPTKYQETGLKGIVKFCHNPVQLSASAYASRWLYHVVGFIIPSIVIVFCFSCALLRLPGSSPRIRKQGSMRAILVLVLAFFICWTPYNIILIVDTASVRKGSSLDTPLIVTAALGCLHSSVNPVLCICFFQDFRCHVLHMLRLRGEEPPNGNLPPCNDRENLSEENGRMCPQESTEQTQC
ncbi:C-X-C chemokine receptor type 3-like [Scleropages formosus]|uniref:C-X-C chemokine receptor type 3-like n=1 Tax=Scleropages formosus TaxID=113540 RepID=A0A8C9VUR7_SCLFO|nr:C-X-C chemokine receptor type 3-like [Scleropages formosus]